MTWIQRTITIKGKTQGCHLITDSVTSQVPELKRIKVGLAHLFLQHTSASLTLNENADPDVRADMDRVLKHIVPAPSSQIIKYQHLDEGDDDMPAHAMCSLLGASLTIPITDGRLNLGTWQGIWLCEHRQQAHTRRIVITIQGQEY